MSIQKTLPGANGTYTVDIGNMIGQISIYMVTGVPTTTGYMRIQGVSWNGETVQIGGAAALPLSAFVLGPVRAGDFGHFKQLIFTMTGIATPPGPIEVLITNDNTAAPDGAYAGVRALTVQSYVETNTKLGTQFFLRTSASIAAGATWYLGFRVGALPVLVKSRECYALVESLELTLLKAPAFSGGTNIPIENYNDIAPVASTVTAVANPTVTSTGTQWGGAEHLYEANATAQRVGAGIPVGGERVLAPGKNYAVALKNNGSGVAQVDYFLTWFEGAPDLPRS